MIKPVKTPVEELLKKDYLTINEYAKAYGVCRNTVSAYISKGQLKTIKVGSRVRIKNTNKTK